MTGSIHGRGATRLGRLRRRYGRAVESPPLFYYASAEQPVHSITSDWAEASGHSAGVVDLHPPDLRPPYGVVATQTCDLVEEGSPKKPWVHLVPAYVYRCSEGLARRIKDGRGPAHFCWASGLGDVDSGVWVVDLRLLLPIEKGWFVGRELIDGFADEEGRSDFAARVGSRFSRTAYASSLVAEVLKPLDTVLGELSERFGGNDGVEKVGLELGRDRLDPQNVRIVFIGDQPLRNEVRAHLTDWWTQTFGGRGPGGLQVLAPEFTDYDQVTARRYAALDFHDISAFSPD